MNNIIFYDNYANVMTAGLYLTQDIIINDEIIMTNTNCVGNQAMYVTCFAFY